MVIVTVTIFSQKLSQKSFWLSALQFQHTKPFRMCICEYMFMCLYSKYILYSFLYLLFAGVTVQKNWIYTYIDIFSHDAFFSYTHFKCLHQNNLDISVHHILSFYGLSYLRVLRYYHFCYMWTNSPLFLSHSFHTVYLCFTS